MTRCMILFVAQLANALFYGEMVVFGMIKHPLTIEFGFSETFLGTLDSLKQVGKFFGCLWLMFFPFEQPKKGFFLFNILKGVFLCLMIFGSSMGSAIKPIYCILILGVGFVKAIAFLPFVYISQHIDARRQQTTMTIFMGTLTLGDTFCLLIGDIVMNRLGWGWKAYIFIFACFIFSSSLAFYLYLREIPFQAPQEESLCTKISQQLVQAKEILSQPNRFFIIAELSLYSCLFYLMATWYPYFFTVIGFPQYAPYLSIVPPFCFFLAPFIIEPLLKCCHKHLQNTIILLLFLNVGVFGWLTILGKDISDQTSIYLLFALIIAQAILYSDPYGRVNLIEMTIEGENNPTIIYYMLNIFTFFQCILSAILYFVIGYSLEKDRAMFFLIFLILSFVLFVVAAIRRKCYITEVPEAEESLDSSESD